MGPKIEPKIIEAHTHLPDSVGDIITILVGLVLLIIDGYIVIPYGGWGLGLLIGFIGVALIVIGFYKLLFRR